MTEDPNPIVLGQERRGAVLILTLNRPEAMNAVDTRMDRQLSDALVAFRDDDSLRVAILTGAGNRAFCAGYDLKERARLVEEPGITKFWRDGESFNLTTGAPILKPIIAAINGHCLAHGLELALACDIRIATPNATFGLPEVKVGVFPGGAATVRLARAIPLSLALEMLFTGDPIDADQALRAGLVSRLVPPDQLLLTALDLAERIGRNAPLAIRLAKEVALRSLDLPVDQAIRFAQAARGMVGHTDDAREGPRAFSEKRPPEYRGR